MNRNGGQPFARLLQQLNRARQQATGGGGGGGRAGRGGREVMPSGNGPAGASGLLLLLVAGGLAVNAAIYNVDGGHRAIKYSRFGGILPDVYPEGTHLRVSGAVLGSVCWTRWVGLTRSDPLGRDADRV